MSKASRRIDDPNQLSIFDLLRDILQSDPDQSTKGRFAIIEPLRDSLRSAIKTCPLSRHQIAGEMSHLLGETIMKEMIDSWTRESDEINGRPGRHIPAEYLPAFCRVTGSNEPIIIMGRLTGLFVLPGPEADEGGDSEIRRGNKTTPGAKKEEADIPTGNGAPRCLTLKRLPQRNWPIF